VAPAITASGGFPVVTYVYLDFDYWRRLAGWWVTEQVLAIVEHDVVVSAEIVAAMESCPASWCCWPYQSGDETLLGCTRFRPSRLGVFPAVKPVHWKALDQAVYAGLRARGLRPHVHLSPKPVHLHGSE
jgi:hypothetical protein